MNSNLLVIIGPVLGLLVVRLFGPWRPLSAFAATVVGQFAFIWATMLWQRQRAMSVMAAPTPGHDMLIAINATHPSFGRRLFGMGALMLIAGLVTMLVIGAQYIVTRKPGAPPPAGF